MIKGNSFPIWVTYLNKYHPHYQSRHINSYREIYNSNLTLEQNTILFDLWLDEQGITVKIPKENIY